MADPNPTQNRPASPGRAPDTATNYERSKPEKEAGQGRLENNQSVPEQRPDRLEQTVHHRQDGAKQINAHDDPGGTGGGGQPLNQVDPNKPD